MRATRRRSTVGQPTERVTEHSNVRRDDSRRPTCNARRAMIVTVLLLSASLQDPRGSSGRVINRDPSIAVAAPPYAPPIAPLPPDPNAPVTTVSWTTPPQPSFPVAAMDQGVREARTILDCAASADGRLSDCVVMAETPAGLGFGEASTAAVADAKLSRRTQEAASGRRVRFSIRYLLADDETPN